MCKNSSGFENCVEKYSCTSGYYIYLQKNILKLVKTTLTKILQTYSTQIPIQKTRKVENREQIKRGKGENKVTWITGNKKNEKEKKNNHMIELLKG